MENDLVQSSVDLGQFTEVGLQSEKVPLHSTPALFESSADRLQVSAVLGQLKTDL